MRQFIYMIHIYANASGLVSNPRNGMPIGTKEGNQFDSLSPLIYLKALSLDCKSLFLFLILVLALELNIIYFCPNNCECHVTWVQFRSLLSIDFWILFCSYRMVISAVWMNEITVTTKAQNNYATSSTWRARAYLTHWIA